MDEVCKSAPLDAGREALDALRSKTNSNPYFAVTSAILHGGQVEYARAQAIADLFADLGPLAAGSSKRALSILGAEGLSVQSGASEVATRLYDGTVCYRVACGKDGKKCLRKEGRETLYGCIVAGFKRSKGKRRLKTGVGVKAGALMMEYLGDDEAVAVDRHVAAWACDEGGLDCTVNDREISRLRRAGKPIVERVEEIIGANGRKRKVRHFFVETATGLKEIRRRKWKRGDDIDPALFSRATENVREHAKGCRVRAADLQVAAWLKGTCRNRLKQRLPLVKGKYISCADVMGQGELFG